MKKILFLSLMLASLSFMQCTRGIEQEPPRYLDETPPPKPSPTHIWVGGRYDYVGSKYVWRNGYYSVPPRGRTVWQRGEYYRKNNRYVYRKGYWRR